MASRLEQLPNFHLEPAGEFFDGLQRRIVPDSDFEMLKSFVAKPALFGGSFLTPPTLFAKGEEFCPEPLGRRLSHLSSLESWP